MKNRMYLVAIVLLSIVLCCCVTPGYTEYTIPITSDAVLGSTAPNSPSLSMPKKGIRPYVGIEYADKQNFNSSSESAESIRLTGLKTGLIFQPSLEVTNIIAPFVTASLSASQIEYRLNLDKETKGKLRALGIDYAGAFTDTKLEGAIQPGFLVKVEDFLFSAFVRGMVKSDTGKFSTFRSKVDNQANIYNLKHSQHTYGFGYGLDGQYGAVGLYDIGLSVTCDVLFNKTQSLPHVDQQININSIELIENGDPYRSMVFALELFVDYKNIRVSTSTNSLDKYSFQVFYKF